MASRSDVVKKIMRLKLKLTDTSESATLLKNLQKLKDLDITLDILSETGIGKTVNSLRRHEEAGEFARSLVRSWKQLVSKDSTSQGGDSLESLSSKDKLDDENCPNKGSLVPEDLNNNSLKRQECSQNSSANEANLERQGRHKDHDEIVWVDGEKTDKPVVFEKNCDQSSSRSMEDDTLLGSKNTEDSEQKETGPETKDGPKSKSDRAKLKDNNRSLLPEYSQKHSRNLKGADVNDGRFSGTSGSPETQDGKRKRLSEQKDAAGNREPKNKEHSKHKKSKSKHAEKASKSEGPSLSFESYLNYDVNVLKKKVKSGVKPPKKTAEKEATKDSGMEAVRSKVASCVASEKQIRESVMELMTLYSPGGPSEYENPITASHSEKKVTKESDFCDAAEESAIFTGQRFNRKMQVYSGAKTIFLPSMMSLHQQCIRTLQNNINLLYETGGVPFEILEPVLERCTPEQLLRIEEYNPVYVGLTDHLWGKHCERDFKDAKLQEYESWREMYMRLSEEREVKLQRLTKSIVSAHSNKPKGRQVKMAFIHTAAKPPRNVRIQQELHGTAVQPPPQLGPCVKVPDNRPRQSCFEQSGRTSTITAGTGSTQDPRKKTRVAPMMAKSLKAFKKQLGRR
eukprot:XP_011601709.1 PREDICTED: transcription elongation factor B polypeptide 3-like [Takifugu rubripes]